MPVGALKSMGKKYGKSTKKMEGYWKAGKEAGKKRGAKNPYAYAMAISKRRAAGSGSKSPKESILKSPAVRAGMVQKTKFERRLDEAIETIAQFGGQTSPGDSALQQQDRLSTIEIGSKVGSELVVKVQSTDKGAFEFRAQDGPWPEVIQQIHDELRERGYSEVEIKGARSVRGS